MPLIPILAGLLPSLIKVAENAFSGSDKGPVKKDFVMSIVESVYDKTLIKLMPDIPRLDEKQLFLDISSVLIEHICKAMKV